MLWLPSHSHAQVLMYAFQRIVSAAATTLPDAAARRRVAAKAKDGKEDGMGRSGIWCDVCDESLEVRPRVTGCVLKN